MTKRLILALAVLLVPVLSLAQESTENMSEWNSKAVHVVRATVDPAAGNDATTCVDANVPGIEVGDLLIVEPSTLEDDVVFSYAKVTATGVARVCVYNSGSQNAAAGEWTFRFINRTTRGNRGLYTPTVVSTLTPTNTPTNTNTPVPPTATP